MIIEIIGERGILHYMPQPQSWRGNRPFTCIPCPPPMCVCVFVLSSLGIRGYYLRENVDILYTLMCILEHIQRRIGIVDEKKKLLRLNTCGDRNHRGGHFALHASALKVGEVTAPPLPPRRPCPVGSGKPTLFVRNHQ